MGLETRLLPRDSWHRLTGTEAEAVWPHLPEAAQVIVVEDGDAIVGCWILMPVLHAECVWIAPAYRSGWAVASRLWRTMHRLARSMGAKGVFTASMDDSVRHLLERHGATKLPGTHYMMPVSDLGE